MSSGCLVAAWKHNPAFSYTLDLVVWKYNLIIYLFFFFLHICIFDACSPQSFYRGPVVLTFLHLQLVS